MRGFNVLYSMGFDSFGLPAEQFAIQTGQHPRITTEQNIANMLSQLKLIGLSHDPDRRFSTTDPEYYRWTQWIFLRLFNSFHDPTVRWRGPNGHWNVGRARPIQHLAALLRSGDWCIDADGRAVPNDRPRTTPPSSEEDIARAVDRSRLAFLEEIPVNWCPGLGTVLANEEVTKDGRSERGDYPVYKRPLRQWMLRITDYAERLIDDLADVDWPVGIKEMQHNWIGRSGGAEIRFHVEHLPTYLTVFSTRADTLCGATFLALTPTHPIIDRITIEKQQNAVRNYRESVERKSGNSNGGEKSQTGAFTGAYAIHPVTGDRLPIWVADYVLAEYGTGAVMGVPAHDQRDFAFARSYGLPIKAVVLPPLDWLAEHAPIEETDPPARYVRDAASFGRAYTGPGLIICSNVAGLEIDGMSSLDAARKTAEWLQWQQRGGPKVRYKLKDWLFSRQRYWGEPFPIVFDIDTGRCHALTDNSLPVVLPDLSDFTPAANDDPNSEPVPPLARATAWANVAGIVLEDGRVRIVDAPVGALVSVGERAYRVRAFRRELNTMPNWAGSCWYYLRYFDPRNDNFFVDPKVERYWSLGRNEEPKAGAIDLYVGGAEHAVLHLLYARFWHKVLYDLEYVSTHEPFQALFNQGMITADAFRDRRGVYQDVRDVDFVESDGIRRAVSKLTGEELEVVSGKMGKQFKNGVPPEEVCAEFSVDTFRLYELYMGPLEASKPWQTSAVVGMMRFLSSVWRNFERVVSSQGSASLAETTSQVQETIVKVTNDMDGLRLNTAIAALIELNRAFSHDPSPSRGDFLTLVLMLAPFAPHIAEEMASRIAPKRHSDAKSVANWPWPIPDETKIVRSLVEVAVTVNGKKRGTFMAAPTATDEQLRLSALGLESVARNLKGLTIKKVITVRGAGSNLINFVAAP